MTPTTTATTISNSDPMELDAINNNRGGPRASIDPVKRERRRTNGLYYCNSPRAARCKSTACASAAAIRRGTAAGKL